jgi:hypothetical protein
MKNTKNPGTNFFLFPAAGALKRPGGEPATEFGNSKKLTAGKRRDVKHGR